MIEFFYKGFGLISVSPEWEFCGGYWSFHLFPKTLEKDSLSFTDETVHRGGYLWGHKMEECFFVEYWGLGPLFLVCRC